MTAIVAASVALTIVIIARKAAPHEVAVEPSAVSIAVLPFRNLTDKLENAYFAEGMQDEILTRLSGIGALKVISRASTAHYASVPADLRNIARELGVANVLEGSVQRSESDVRINVQLIRAKEDTNVWSATYDRKLTDVFGVESEVAKAIADSLKATLTGEEQQALAVAPTASPEAYDQYLRGLAFDLRSFEPVNLSQAAEFLHRAVTIDPGFALAHARLASVDAKLAYQGIGPGAALCNTAGQEAALALKLKPSLGEAHLAQGYYLYLCRSDLDHAQEEFEHARSLLPNSAEALEAMGKIARRRGAWEQSIDYTRQAIELDPRNTALLGGYAMTLAQLRQFDEARAVADKALDVTPGDSAMLALQVFTFQAEGQLDRAQALLDAFSPQSRQVDAFDYQILQLLYLGHDAEAGDKLKLALAQDLGPIGEGAGDYFYLLGVAQRAAGDVVAARDTFRRGHAYLAGLASTAQSTDNDIYLNALLCLMEAGSGEPPDAEGDAKGACRSTEVVAASDSPFAPSAREALARADALRGRIDLAIAPLDGLLHGSYYSFLYSVPLSPALLRQDPVWNPLRGDARFRTLAAMSADQSDAKANR